MNSDRSDEIVNDHADHLVNVVRRNLPHRLRSRMDPEDVVQSVFRSFFRRRQQGQLDDDTVHDVGQLLVTMTLNKVRNAIQFHQRGRRDVRHELRHDHLDSAIEADTDASNAEFETILAELIERLLNGLPEIHREMVLLRIRGTSIAEIAAQVHRSQRTVIRVLSGLEKLAQKDHL